MALAVDEVGIRVAEVSHSDGLGGASIDYGSPDATDQAYLGAVCGTWKKSIQRLVRSASPDRNYAHL